MTLGRLDYLYTPSDDVAADLRYLVDVLGGEQVFAIEDGGIRVAMVALRRAAGDPPDRPPRGRPPDPPLRGRRPRGGAGRARGARLGAGALGRAAAGPAITFRTPGGLRMAHLPAEPAVRGRVVPGPA